MPPRKPLGVEPEAVVLGPELGLALLEPLLLRLDARVLLRQLALPRSKSLLALR